MASAVAQLATSKGGGHRQHSIEEYAEALRTAKGMVSQAARILDVSQQAVRQRLAKSPLLRQTVADARDAMTDAAELTLYNRIVAGDAWAVCFYLKTQGRDRGYVERSEHEHTGAGGGPLRIVVERVDDRLSER